MSRATVSKLAICAALAAGGYAAPAVAQTAASVDNGALQEVVVTARRRPEELLKAPLTITAMSGDDLTARSVTSVQDLAQFVPGMNVLGQASGAGRSDRSAQAIIIRGMAPSSTSAQTTSIFIDGVPVSSATAIQTITSPARVEVLKGPQAAYFGRQTFAGAINIITKAPTDAFSANVAGMVGTRDNYDVLGEVSIPLIKDVLGVTATARTFGKNGSYDNAGVPGETLGDQRTRTGSLAAMFKPTDRLTFKAFGLYTALKDGPSANGLISAYGLTEASGRLAVADQSNCTLRGVNPLGVVLTNRYICGVTPGLSSVTPSSNTQVDSWIANYLANPAGRIVSPKHGTKGYGLASRFYHLHFAADWELGDSGFTLSSLTGYNDEYRSTLADFDNYYSVAFPNVLNTNPSAPSYFNYPLLNEGVNKDTSQEVRLTYANDGKLNATLGASYLNATAINSGGGGNSTLVSTISGKTRNRTYGVFYGLTYKFTPELSASFEGRYQIDKIYAYSAPAGTTASTSVFIPAGFYPGGALLLERTYKNFLPRVIVQYDVTPQAMIYASYSKGINPAAFNTGFLTASATSVQAATIAGFKVAVEPEKLSNLEAGIKGRLLENRVQYELSAYHSIWSNQLNRQAYMYALNGVAQQITATANVGKVRLMGLEASIAARPTRNVTLDLRGAYTDSSVRTAQNSSVTTLTGLTDFTGKENPFTSKWSGSLGAQYEDDFAMIAGASWYGRADLTYKSGSYSNVANVVRTPAMSQVNVRAGVRTARANIEVFVTNLFNDRAYASVTDAGLANNTFSFFSANSGVVVQLRELRTVGVRVSHSF